MWAERTPTVHTQTVVDPERQERRQEAKRLGFSVVGYDDDPIEEYQLTGEGHTVVYSDGEWLYQLRTGDLDPWGDPQPLGGGRLERALTRIVVTEVDYEA